MHNHDKTGFGSGGRGAPLRILAAALMVAALGCGPTGTGNTPDGGQSTPDGGGSQPAPAIQTTSLADAENGKPYSQRVSATGGTLPLVWTLEGVPDALRWLRVEPSTGELGGTPTAVVMPAQEFDLKVTDADGRSDTRKFSLEVVSCREGQQVDCTFASGTACLVGTQTCESGRFSECSGGAPSTDTSACGTSCGACGEAANQCADGRCKCGDAEPCADAAAPTCCGEGADGSCVDTQSDLEHCGACGTSCTDTDGDGDSDVPAGTDPACTGGTCSYACKAGFARCPADAAFCINVTDDPQNCGGCGNVCPTSSNPPPNTTVPSDACTEGVCQVSCKPGYTSCNADMFADGCEIHTAEDENNCGACGNVCGGKPNAAGYVCTTGACKVAAGGCAAGWADKNGLYEDGCEVNLMTDMYNCGSINNMCGNPATGTGACINGTCTITSCPAGYRNCDGAYANGCEADLDSDNSCGSCGKVCGGSSSCNGLGKCCYQECDPDRKPPCMTICE